MQVPLSSASNPRLPMLFRVIASVEWLVLGVTGFGLFLLLGVTQSVLGLFAILGIVIVNASQHTVDWTQPGTWVWIGLFAILMLTGIVMTVLAVGKLLVQRQGRKSWADSSAPK